MLCSASSLPPRATSTYNFSRPRSGGRRKNGYICGSPISQDSTLKRSKVTQRRRRLAADEEAALLKATCYTDLHANIAPVAQRIEHPPPKRGAASSILAGRAI